MFLSFLIPLYDFCTTINCVAIDNKTLNGIFNNRPARMLILVLAHCNAWKDFFFFLVFLSCPASPSPRPLSSFWYFYFYPAVPELKDTPFTASIDYFVIWRTENFSILPVVTVRWCTEHSFKTAGDKWNKVVAMWCKVLICYKLALWFRLFQNIGRLILHQQLHQVLSFFPAADIRKA